MTKRRRIERKATATRAVTVRLHGWPAETRLLSLVDACWMVDLQFTCRDCVRSHMVYESADYDKAFAKYEAFLKIME
jgi:hypothetical protein